ncbi:hypothetical protein JOC77_000656 [Peribacillus deserti]|uniref:Uncharacterized protein n=1 Tax=Peribacillus deserti TaxID=673318 RepID=A0ABS2QDL1_9BACI|nr:hypothetical protein [Peribacillus deserti]
MKNGLIILNNGSINCVNGVVELNIQTEKHLELL